MDIHEEYHKRQRLKTPLVRYPNASYLWVRRQGAPRWAALSVSFVQKDEDRRPGKMHLSLLVPNHDEYYGQLLSRRLWDKAVEWDEWHEYIKAWANDNRREDQMVPAAEVQQAVWECFCYSADSYLAQVLSDRLLDRLHLSLTDKGPEADIAKVEIIEHLVKGTLREFQEHVKTLRELIKPENQAVWLSDLMAA